MSVKALKPITPGQRGRVVNGFDAITTDKPEKSLLSTKKRTGGRNSQGKMTMKFIGGGHKKRYRIIDFKRDRHDDFAEVVSIEYDPNRSAFIALTKFKDNEKRYIIALKGLKVGSKVVSGSKKSPDIGNCMPLSDIPLGTIISSIEMKPGKGAQIARSAGTSARLVAKEGIYATLRLQSGEMRKILSDCRATLGTVSNQENNLRSLGKAGAKRWRGVRPTVRGVAMNPVDHPHGGGEGRTSGGRHPSTPWGIPTKGYKTRKNQRTDDLIIRRRGSRK